jgi:hypothetical protein
LFKAIKLEGLEAIKLESEISVKFLSLPASCRKEKIGTLSKKRMDEVHEGLKLVLTLAL